MTDNEIVDISEKLSSLQDKILKSRFAETVTESEMLSLVLATQEINHQKAEIERLENELKITREYIHDNNLELDLLTKIKHNSLCETETYESR